MEKILSVKTSLPEDTEKLAQKLIKTIFAKEKNLFLLLSGPLGSGKTKFCQGIGKALEIKEKIKSPSFVIIKRYPLKNQKWKNFYHIDLFRIKSLKEVLNIQIKDILKQNSKIVAIEWPKSIEKILPKPYFKIKFKILSKNQRQITIEKIL
jgi:tRNA threonylcarbamoyladenosine biosynthesis protein TsaE